MNQREELNPTEAVGLYTPTIGVADGPPETNLPTPAPSPGVTPRPLTEAELAGIEARVNEVTKGTAELKRFYVGGTQRFRPHLQIRVREFQTYVVPVCDGAEYATEDCEPYNRRANMDFILHAFADIPALLADRAALTAALQASREGRALAEDDLEAAKEECDSLRSACHTLDQALGNCPGCAELTTERDAALLERDALQTAFGALNDCLSATEECAVRAKQGQPFKGISVNGSRPLSHVEGLATWFSSCEADHKAERDAALRRAEAAEAERDDLNQTSGDLCSECGWRGKRSDGCEFCLFQEVEAERDALRTQLAERDAELARLGEVEYLEFTGRAYSFCSQGNALGTVVPIRRVLPGETGGGE